MAASRPKRWSNALSPPVFHDLRLDDVARLVYSISLLLPVVTVVLALIVFVFARERIGGMVLVAVTVWATAAAAIVLLRSKRPVAAARIIVVGFWIISTAFMLLAGGLSSPAVIGPLFAIALAGILLGQRACVAMVAVVTVTAFGTAWAQQTLGLDSAAPLATPWLRAGFIGAYAAAAAALQIVAFQNLSAAVGIARQANDNLAAAGKVYDTTSEGIVVTDVDGSIVDVNDAYARMHGYERVDVIGKNPRMMKSARHDASLYSDMWGALLKEGSWQGEVWNRRADGSLLPTWLSLSAVKDTAGITMNYVGVVSDITALKRGEEDLQWLATHDPLTRLPNRILIEDRLTNVLALSRRRNSEAAVFFLDLDHFKDVNDTLGHPAGDRLLIEIADRCRAVLREGDTIGRIGGDEFSVVVTDLSDVEYVAELAQRLLRVIREPMALGGEQASFVTASIGIAVYPADGSDASELNQHAEVAMYRAKELGRDRSEFFNAGLQRELLQRVEVEAGLRRALDENRLFLVYQPQVYLSTGQIVGVEALVRWRTVDGSVFMPDRFIPVAESSGLIIDVGAFVLRQACADMRLLSSEGHHLTMALNVSAREWMEQDVATIIVGAIKEAGLSPSVFEVEITESSIVTQTHLVATKVRNLQEQGVSVSIDDFGTGYGSMSYVMDFHPTKLKIDRSFVSSLPHDQGARAIVDATIALADGIGATVIAEGPETEEQIRYLRERGCGLAQGFYFSRGVVLDELRQLLQGGPYSVPDAAPGSTSGYVHK